MTPATKPAQKVSPNGRPELEIVPRPQGTRTANILLYGPPKVGKTTAAASGPARVLYANCELPAAMTHADELHGDKLDRLRVEGLKTLIDLPLHIKARIADDDLPWKTFVCDPMADLYRLLLEDLTNGATHVPLNVHNDAQVHIERFERAMCALPINTVWVAHETTQKDEVRGHFESIPAMGTTNPNPAGKLMAMVDVIGYCGVTLREGQEPEYQAQLINANGRRGGDRFNVLGKLRALDLNEWSERIAEIQPKGAAG